MACPAIGWQGIRERFRVVVDGGWISYALPDRPGALAALRRVLKRGGRVIVPTFCHDETALSWVVSRALAVTGFPGHWRFTSA